MIACTSCVLRRSMSVTCVAGGRCGRAKLVHPDRNMKIILSCLTTVSTMKGKWPSQNQVWSRCCMISAARRGRRTTFKVRGDPSRRRCARTVGVPPGEELQCTPVVQTRPTSAHAPMGKTPLREAHSQFPDLPNRQTRDSCRRVVDSEAHVQGKPGHTKIQLVVPPITEKRSRTLSNTSATPISRLNLRPSFLEASLSTCPSRYIVLYMSIRDPLSWVACGLCGVATRLQDGWRDLRGLKVGPNGQHGPSPCCLPAAVM